MKNKGNACVKSQDYKGASEHYTKSIKLDPTEPSGYTNRALTYIKLQEYHKAIADGKRAAHLSKSFARAYQRIAEAYLGLKDYHHAFVYAKALLKVDPTNKTVMDFSRLLGK
jgi:stress-induced-phosphoprotein 1